MNFLTNKKIFFLLLAFFVLLPATSKAATCNPPNGKIEVAKKNENNAYRDYGSSIEVLAGETFHLKVTGYDDNDVWYLYWSHKDANEWDLPGYSDKCVGTDLTCFNGVDNFKVTESEPGTYYYSAKIRDSDNYHDCDSWHEYTVPETVEVTVAAPVVGEPLVVAGASIFPDYLNLPGVFVGENFTYYVGAMGGASPITFKKYYSGVSEWDKVANSVFLNETTGKISGWFPKGGVTYHLTVQIQDSSTKKQTLYVTYAIPIKDSQLTILTTGLPNSGAGLPYPETQLQAAGGTPSTSYPPYTWSVVRNKPAWLTLSPDGKITGPPSAANTYTFDVEVKDKNKSAPGYIKTFSITIESACQCSDGTLCNQCKAGDATLSRYCDGATKTLIYNETCRAGGQTGQTGGSQTGGGSSLGVIDVGKLEVNWPNSPLGTPLNSNLNNGKGPTLTDLIKYLYEWGIGIGGFLAFISLIIAGFQYLTSVGNAGAMTDAINRIRSAGLGLLLLFGSFLILNTVNPQLTDLKMPTITPESGGLNPISTEKVNLSTKGCAKATLYSGINKSGTSVLLLTGREIDPLSQQVGSVEIEGSCRLTLYRLTGLRDNADNPPETVIGEGTSNIQGTTKFGSAKLDDLFTAQ